MHNTIIIHVVIYLYIMIHTEVDTCTRSKTATLTLARYRPVYESVAPIPATRSRNICPSSSSVDNQRWHGNVYVIELSRSSTMTCKTKYKEFLQLQA